VRVGIIVDAYQPFRSSAAIQITDLAREFALEGHDVIVITPAAGQKNPWVDEFSDEVRVLRLSAPQTKNIGRIRRALSEILLPFFMIINFRKSPFVSLKLDGIVWYSPTIFFGPLVHILKWQNKCRSYLILRDLFPDVAVDLGILRRGVIYKFFKLFEIYQYSLADTIGVQSKANLEYLHIWAKQPNKHLEVLNNWLSIRPDLGLSASIEKSNLVGKTVLVYAGNFGLMQGIHVVIDLALKFDNRKDVIILLVGRGSELSQLKSEAESRGLKNIIFHDEIDPSEVPALLAQCDIGLLFLDPRLKTHNIPGKLISYMQAGLPVLARINIGNDLFDLIKESEIGLVHAGDDVEPFLAMAESLVNDAGVRTIMSKKCRSKVVEMFSSTVACKQILAALKA
jgi:glycosyltransferase involved in cell wall biosynthesis